MGGIVDERQVGIKIIVGVHDMTIAILKDFLDPNVTG